MLLALHNDHAGLLEIETARRGAHGVDNFLENFFGNGAGFKSFDGAAFFRGCGYGKFGGGRHKFLFVGLMHYTEKGVFLKWGRFTAKTQRRQVFFNLRIKKHEKVEIVFRNDFADGAFFVVEAGAGFSRWDGDGDGGVAARGEVGVGFVADGGAGVLCGNVFFGRAEFEEKISGIYF